MVYYGRKFVFYLLDIAFFEYNFECDIILTPLLITKGVLLLVVGNLKPLDCVTVVHQQAVLQETHFTHPYSFQRSCTIPNSGLPFFGTNQINSIQFTSNGPKGLQPLRFIGLREDDQCTKIIILQILKFAELLWSCLEELLGLSLHVEKCLSFPVRDCCSLRAGGLQSCCAFHIFFIEVLL